jgi:hypothetical protein
MDCIDCRYSLLKDGLYNCTYEEGECIKINVLEKENAELERRLEQTEKDLADYQFNYPTIKELQKENAELNKQIEKMKCCENCKHSDTECEGHIICCKGHFFECLSNKIFDHTTEEKDYWELRRYKNA